MKTAREFCIDNNWILTSQAVGAIAARDAEHLAVLAEVRAELEGLKEQNRLLSEHCNDRNALRTERDRLKGELAEARRLIDSIQADCPWCRVGGIGHYDWCPKQKFLAAPSPSESPDAHPAVLLGSGPMRRDQTCWWLAHRHAGAHEMRSASPAESTGVHEFVWSRTGACMECGKAEGERPPHPPKPAAPPDDIRERTNDALVRLAQQEQIVGHLVPECADHERRLKALEATVSVLCDWADGAKLNKPAAPQEQAGHAFTNGPLAPELCGFMTGATCCRTMCCRRIDDPVHTGAKP